MRKHCSFADRALLCACLLLCGTSLATAQDVRVRLDLTAEQYSAALKEAADEGGGPSQLAVYSVGGEDRFALVLEPDLNVPWLEKRLLAPQEFQDQFEAYLGQGYRPVSVAVSQAGDAPRFSAIWWKQGEPTWHVHLDVTPEQLPELSREYAARELRPISLLGYNDAGQTRFAAVWEAGRPETEFDLALTTDEYRKSVAARSKSGFQPASLHAYVSAQGPRVAAVWVKRPRNDGVVSEVRSLASRNEFSDFVRTGTRGGRVTHLSSTMVEGTPVFSVIVERNAK
jgi:ribulose bisphosphate carboxylase small subunit